MPECNCRKCRDQRVLVEQLRLNSRQTLVKLAADVHKRFDADEEIPSADADELAVAVINFFASDEG